MCVSERLGSRDKLGGRLSPTGEWEKLSSASSQARSPHHGPDAGPGGHLQGVLGTRPGAAALQPVTLCGRRGDSLCSPESPIILLTVPGCVLTDCYTPNLQMTAHPGPSLSRAMGNPFLWVAGQQLRPEDGGRPRLEGSGGHSEMAGWEARLPRAACR